MDLRLSNRTPEPQVFLYQLAVFWAWVIAFVAAMGVALFRVIDGQAFSDLHEILLALAAVYVPQLSVMLAFFFGSPSAHAEARYRAGDARARMAVHVSLSYQLLVAILLYVMFFLWNPEVSVKEQVDTYARWVGTLSFLGIAPLGYLFYLPQENGGER